jgi:hypothetical protein
MASKLVPARVDARRKRRVHSPGFMNRILPCLLALSLSGLAAAPARAADIPAEQQERARWLRRQLESDPAPGSAREPVVLPGARLDGPAVREREQLDLARDRDQAWRQLLGEQQAGRIRQEMTGIPSVQAPARAMGAERDQRMRELSARIHQQDRQFRQDALR